MPDAPPLDSPAPAHRITRLDQLDALYGPPLERAVRKETDRLIPPYRRLVEAAPFCVLATVGPKGLDVSPRGDGPGFVAVIDERTLVLPDRKGNNRIDSLRNLVDDPRVSLIFLIPGVGETLRVSGTAAISTDPDLLERHAIDGKRPLSALVVTVERTYFQCAKALVRSRLWDPAAQIDRHDLPSTGEMLAATSEAGFDADGYDRDAAARLRSSLY